MQDLTSIAMQCFQAGLSAAEPGRGVTEALERDSSLIEADGFLTYVAIGKAAVPMMRAAMAHRAPDRAFLVTNYENAAKLPGCDCHAAGHPTPDENGAAAAEALIRLLDDTWAGDRVLVLLSGGGSALLPAPIEGLSLADKVALNDLLLLSGMPIGETNAVRRRFSRLKGGGLNWLASPAEVASLILSDVPGDDLSVIASGPTVPVPGEDDGRVREILKAYGLWERAPEAIRAELQRPAARRRDEAAENRIIGSNSRSVAAMADRVPRGFARHVADAPLVGDVRDAARTIADTMRRAASRGPGVLLFGGETTVRVRGKGKGGRNQELCLHVARLLAREPIPGDWVFLSAGTDGRDGPTDAAGGIVTPETIDRLSGSGMDICAELARNNSHAILKAAGALLETGATGTNVADLQVAVLEGGATRAQ